MTPAEAITSSSAGQLAPSIRLRWWLILLSIGAVVFVGLAVIFGLLINMDTKIEMNPNGDPLVRQDAIGFRLFTWGGVAFYILLLAAGVIAGWIAYRRRRNRMSFGLSLLAAIPILLPVAGFSLLILQEIL